MLQEISDLIVDCDDFATVANRAQQFCPFEAIGMVRQEIRHSSFLCYLLEPSRPHGLGEIALRALLMALANGQPAEKLDFHFRDLAQARIWRERFHIDILIEIPPSEGKGLVVAIELKVDAVERQEQLSDYATRLERHYSDRSWKRVHCFLTPDGRAGETHGESAWVNISMGALLSRIEAGIERAGATGEASQLFKSYLNMMKRHNIVKDDSDPQLTKAVRDVWRKHKETLDFLMEHRPDPLAEVWAELGRRQADVAETLSRSAEVEIGPDDSSSRIQRYSFIGLKGECPDLFRGDKTWLGSGAQCVFEITLQQEAVVASLVVGPAGDQPAFRDALAAVLEARSGQGLAKPKYAHYWPKTIASWDQMLFVDDKLESLLAALQEYASDRAQDAVAAIRAAQSRT
ncbi:PD-(D/E)XK nuclease family protein [Roseovarius sp. C7]|uniref:PD-(D/E)XK nuclease family protein n=1 Tax=Roseovarius sp. C7 TaxID=3398643 RepID=UPI0039F700CD